MMFNVPQFIDVEDKIAGPLTWKQLFWMIGMGGVLLVIFAFFETGFGIIISVPIVLLFMALAFYRPNGFPMTTFLFHSVLFIFRPKVAVWERPVGKPFPQQKESETSSPSPVPETPVKKELTGEKLKELAKLIDSE